MDRRKRNITALGLLIVIATVVFFWGLYYLLGNPFLTNGLDLVVALENGAGLKRGDRVYLNGVDIGTVQNVDLAATGEVLVEIRVRGDLSLPSDTRAAVMGDVFGAHTMDLKPGAALLRMEDGDTLHGAATPQITQLAADLGAKASSALNAFDSLLSPQAVRDVQATAAVLPASAAELRAALSELKLTAAALRRTAEGVAEAETGAAVTSAVNEVEKSARALTTAIGTIEGSFARSLGSFETVMARIDRGDGTLGRLVNDSTLYVEMSNTLREMRMLAGDIRERPGRYFTVRIF